MSDPSIQRTFTSLSSFTLPASSRLSQNAFCPTKDLLAFVWTTEEGIEKVSLWKATGAKVWDVAMGKEERVVEMAWSPDGNFLMIAHHPARLTLHSVHDGHELASVTVPYTQTPDPGGKGKAPAREAPAALRNMWWLRDEGISGSEGEGKSWKRKEEPIAGSAECLLRSMPYLTPLREVRTETSIFSLTKDKPPAPSRVLPASLLSFPSLLVDPHTASIQHTRGPSTPSARLKDDEAVRSAANDGSLLVVSDSQGTLHFFLQGTYPLGVFSLGADCTPYAVHLLPSPSPSSPTGSPAPATLMLSFRRSSPSASYIGGCSLSLPLLRSRPLRTTARLSSLLRELLVLVHQTTDDMARTWVGSDGMEGAKDVGGRWVGVLARRGEGRTDAIFDLVQLLVTGRPRPSMVEFLGGLTERTWESWNSTVHNALKSMERNCLERIIPACERCIVVLEELKGWSLWEDAYGEFDVPTADVEACIAGALKMIELSQALATHILEERWSFDAMMVWLRWEVQRLSQPDPTERPEHPGHDILQVSEYILTSLSRSPIDGWFAGPLPSHTATTLAREGVEGRRLEGVMGAARRALGGGVEGGWRMRRPRMPVSPAQQEGSNEEAVQETDYPPSRTAAERLALALPARNLPALLGELESACRDVCVRAAGAGGRGAGLVRHWEVVRSECVVPPSSSASSPPAAVGKGAEVEAEGAKEGEAEGRGWYREAWTTEGDTRTQYIALLVHPDPDVPSTPSARPQLCILRLSYDHPPGLVRESSAVLLSLDLAPPAGLGSGAGGEGEARREWAMVQWEFFDPVNLLVVLRWGPPPASVSSASIEAEPSASASTRTVLTAVFYPDLPYVRLGGRDRDRGDRGAVDRGVGEGGDTFGKVRAAVRSGELAPLPLPISRSRPLRTSIFSSSFAPIQLCTNGRPKRRTAAVLGGREAADVVVFDLHGQEEEGEEGVDVREEE